MKTKKIVSKKIAKRYGHNIFIENIFGGKTYYFEHGEAGSTINGGFCNNHAHLHLVNSGKKIENYSEKLLEEMNKILYHYKGLKIKDKDIYQIDGIIKNPNYLENLQDITKGGSYYQIGDGEKSYIIKNGNDYHKSQLIREAGAKLLEGKDAFYDWKNTDAIREYLKSGKENYFIKELKNRTKNLENIF